MNCTIYTPDFMLGEHKELRLGGQIRAGGPDRGNHVAGSRCRAEEELRVSSGPHRTSSSLYR